MKPLRHSLVPDGRGHRTPQTMLLLDERDALLIEAAARFFPGMSDREIARRLHTALSIYHDGRWRRDQSEATCPTQHQGKLTQVLWLILKTSDHPPSARVIRRTLAIRGPTML